MDGCRGFGWKGGMNPPVESSLVKFLAVTVIAIATCPSPPPPRASSRFSAARQPRGRSRRAHCWLLDFLFPLFDFCFEIWVQSHKPGAPAVPRPWGRSETPTIPAPPPAGGCRTDCLAHPYPLRKGHSPRFIAKGGLIALFPPPSAELIWVTMGKGSDCHGKAGRHQRGVQTARSLFSVR